MLFHNELAALHLIFMKYLFYICQLYIKLYFIQTTFIFVFFLLFWTHYLKAQVDNKDKHRLIDRTAYILKVVEQFGKVLPHLNKHSEGYPDLNQLMMIVKQGQSLSNMDDAGQDKKCKVHIPTDAMGKNIHIILALTDKGTPALTVYRRVVVEVNK